MGILNRELIKSAKLKTEDVECPELGGAIRLQELSVGVMQSIDKKDLAQQLSLMIIDEEGNLLFNDAEGIQILKELKASVGTRLIVAAAKLNGIDQTVIDETIKNLLASQSADSATA